MKEDEPVTSQHEHKEGKKKKLIYIIPTKIIYMRTALPVIHLAGGVATSHSPLSVTQQIYEKNKITATGQK